MWGRSRRGCVVLLACARSRLLPMRHIVKGMSASLHDVRVASHNGRTRKHVACSVRAAAGLACLARPRCMARGLTRTAQAGFAGEDAPKSVYPSVVGVPSEETDRKKWKTGSADIAFRRDDMELRCVHSASQ